ncbi:MAG: right-handed parallel beta-helix repeat-containing protein [Anaerolineales bacterium]
MKKSLCLSVAAFAVCWWLSSCGGGPAPTPTPSSEIVVNSTGDEGQGLCDHPEETCTLREAIQHANHLPGTILIRFNIPGSGLRMIQPNSALPAITNTIILDGTTQPGYVGTPLIEIEGSLTSATPGLMIDGPGSAVKGLIIVDFKMDGIDVRAPNVILAGNYIGTDGGADVNMRNDRWGIDVTCAPSAAPSGVVIGGSMAGDRNVISNNGFGGINFDVGMCDSFDAKATVAGNYIGTAAAGAQALGNHGPGISINRVSDVTVGGTASGAGNLISANTGNGVEVKGPSAKTSIQGNSIGTNAAGDAALGNQANGVYSEGDETLIGGETAGARNLISGNAVHGVSIQQGPALVEGNWIGLNRAGTGALGNAVGVEARSCVATVQIGGDTTGARNVISGNLAEGILVEDINCDSGQVNIYGNYVGTDPNGTAAIGNLDGIHVMAAHVVIGGESGQFRNKISGNHDNGVVIERDHTQVIGNFIGTEVNGLSALANEYNGVVIRGTASDNLVKFNTVAYNGGFGVWIMGSGMGNRVTQNHIHDNGTLGIAIDEPNVIPNDPLDADTGANGRQNFPTVQSAFISGDNDVVMGTMHGAANTTYQIEIFANDACDPTGYGEGQRFMVDTTATTDGAGEAEFHGGISVSSFLLTPGMFTTATATDPDGNTSGFSQCVEVTEAPTPTLAPTSGGMQFKPTVNPMAFFYGGCTPGSADFSLDVLDPPEPIDYTLLFVRVVDKKSGEAGAWSQGLSMSKLGPTKFFFTLTLDKIPDYGKFADAWLQYQFVAYNKAQKEIGRSGVYSDVTLGKCGGAGVTPAKKPGTTG